MALRTISFPPQASAASTSGSRRPSMGLYLASRPPRRMASFSDSLEELMNYNTQRVNRLEKKLFANGTPYSAGQDIRYANFFIYNSVYTVLKC
mmetsp:Transcript_2638/g.5436  ORF Transcript_2638/g.5436 Transcript_2638/m.5436 type:complete len:93 (-) Transcript_2638:100-378(-)